MYKKKHYLCIRKLTKASGTGLTLNTQKMEENILKALREKESYLLFLRDRAERLRQPIRGTHYLLAESEILGMLKIAQIAGINIDEFQWIYY